jgi:hypothetical protein
MTLVNFVGILIVVGLIMWLINTYVPMAGAIKSLLNIVVFVVRLIWLLQMFGLVGNIPGLRIRGRDIWPASHHVSIANGEPIAERISTNCPRWRSCQLPPGT